jgi:hypothetical protein
MSLGGSGIRTTFSPRSSGSRSRPPETCRRSLTAKRSSPPQSQRPAHEALVTARTGGHGELVERLAAAGVDGDSGVGARVGVDADDDHARLRISRGTMAADRQRIGLNRAQPRAYQVTLALLAEAAGDTTSSLSQPEGDTAVRSQPAVPARLAGDLHRARVSHDAIERGYKPLELGQLPPSRTFTTGARGTPWRCPSALLDPRLDTRSAGEPERRRSRTR